MIKVEDLTAVDDWLKDGKRRDGVLPCGVKVIPSGLLMFTGGTQQPNPA